MKIVYKLVSALLCVGAVVSVFTASLFSVVNSPLLGSPTEFNLSVSRISQLAGGSFSDAADIFLKNEAFAPIKAALIAAAVFLMLAVAVAAAALVTALITDKPVFNIAYGAAGIVCLICCTICVSSVSSAFAAGEVSAAGFLDLGLLSGLVGSVVNIVSVKVGTAVTLMFGCFISMLVWALIFVLSEVGAEPKKAKKSPKKKAVSRK